MTIRLGCAIHRSGFFLVCALTVYDHLVEIVGPSIVKILVHNVGAEGNWWLTAWRKFEWVISLRLFFNSCNYLE